MTPDKGLEELSPWQFRFMSIPDAEQALVRAYVACRIALESLDGLPPETAEAVTKPAHEFCQALEPYVGHLTSRESRRDQV